MLLVPILAVLSQAPAAPATVSPLGPVAVVLTSRRKKAEIVGTQVLRHLRQLVADEELGEVLAADVVTTTLQAKGFGDTRACEGTRLCLLKAAELLGPRSVLIGVDVGVIGRSLALTLEAVTAEGRRSLASAELAVPSRGWTAAAAPELTAFLDRVKLAMEQASVVAPAPPPLPSPPLTEAGSAGRSTDAPTRASATEPTAGPGVGVAARGERAEAALDLDLSIDTPSEDASASRPRTGAIVTTAVAGALVATAAILVGVGLDSKARFDGSLYTLPDGSTGSRLSEAEASALAGRANLQLNGALGAAALGLTAGGVAVFLWANP